MNILLLLYYFTTATSAYAQRIPTRATVPVEPSPHLSAVPVHRPKVSSSQISPNPDRIHNALEFTPYYGG
ncbi:unnamed protein product [Anisakis simplex]|uniref:Secreted protein n=1 Tax=Anisakis simplex TaxID=6269 RepID=A0A0M3JJK0_ANISI|nr:unnamed protein product [Anisakis simplex]